MQGMVKSGMAKFDKEASWYPDLENELMTISDSGPRGAHDDQFDAFSYIGLAIDEYFEALSDEELEEEVRSRVIELPDATEGEGEEDEADESEPETETPSDPEKE